MFEFAEHRSELIGLLIEVFVVGALFKTVGFRRDTSLGIIIMDSLDQTIRIIGLIC